MLSWFKRKRKIDETSPELSPAAEASLEDTESVQESPEEELAEDLFFEVPAATPQEPAVEPEIDTKPLEDIDDGDESLAGATSVKSENDIETSVEPSHISEPEPEPEPVVDIETPIETVEVEAEEEVDSEEVYDEPVTPEPTEASFAGGEIVNDKSTDTEESSIPAEFIDDASHLTDIKEPFDEEVTGTKTLEEVKDDTEEPQGPIHIKEGESLVASTTPQEKPQEKKKSFFSRLADRLSRTRESFTYQLDTLFLGKKEIDADLLDDLEELLITADLGVSTTQEILDHARRKVKRNELDDPQSLKTAIQEKIKSFISDHQEDAALVMPDEGPFVIMVVGVNGVGKTTTIGKIAHKFIRSGQSVLLVAADTFRAAAISQLKIWGERNNVPVASQDEGSDPSSVVYDAIAHAKAKNYDVVLVDTAGRLHTQANLMEELKKIKRVMAKQLNGAPHEVMLIVDATTGQNGISQAKLFNEAVEITGITLTKLDGTAKGGIVANICRELKTPIRFIGIGETIDDLRDFDADEFIEALFQDRNSGVEE
ncbi:signal recognition particle-docking protein FtsY [Desulfopila sp. IMCC35008]|uniref:signal recognition particle-docking protein FtsY n=1 Tax=Desulfopila sp. IMCC35008 TaxID=2653858 RepID=UPI0013D60198|nr:signal recognition particle-docking protein FtsY [Desulfopila sp. IMCC35008]